MTNDKNHRPIRSFVKRQGRMTVRQQRGLDQGWPQFGITATDTPLDFETIFNNNHPVVLEIGFGMGHSLLIQAQNNPDINYIGIEIHNPGVGSLLSDILEYDLKNLRIIQQDAVEILKNNIIDNSLAGVQIYFPDPWHKKRHHKRRLIQADFIRLVVTKLQNNGFIHCATDWQDYAEQILQVLTDEPQLTNQSDNDYWPNDGRRPETKFERRGHRLGHGVWDLLFCKA